MKPVHNLIACFFKVSEYHPAICTKVSQD
jgi:hypothetical protein